MSDAPPDYPSLELPIVPPFAPMEAKLVAALPKDDAYQLEPKWDGFRCLVFRDHGTVVLQSKAGQPLTRYFPEVVANIGKIRAKRFVLDGEIVIAGEGTLDFDALLQRIHPAESRIRKLAKETPAHFVAFDLLVDARGKSLVDWPQSKRRAALEDFAAAHLSAREDEARLSPATTDRAVATSWESTLRGHGIDGLVAKRLDLPYASGERAMLKAKWMRTADCVVGGFRYASNDRLVGSLLLGLYDDDGLLNHVGFVTMLHHPDRAALTKKLEKLRASPGFTGRAPGGPSRWNRGKSHEWEPVAPKLVVEVRYDHASGDRFRHGAKLLRMRPDKAPQQCTMSQLSFDGHSAKGARSSAAQLSLL